MFPRTLFCIALIQHGAGQFLDGAATCNLATFVPFTDIRPGPPDAHANMNTYGYGTWPNASALAQASFSLVAAAALAQDHFNRRDSTLVPELGDDLIIDCPVTVNLTVFDSAYDRRTTTQTLWEYASSGIVSAGNQNKVCAVIGPATDRVSQGLASLTEALSVPQISYGSNGYRLTNQAEYPGVTRVLPVAYDVGYAVTMWLNRDIFQREGEGIIYEDTDYGEQLESPIEDLEEDLGYLTITESFHAGDDDGIRSAFQEAKDKGFRTIVLVTDQVSLLDDVARVADDMDMLGPGYLYMISGGALPRTLLAEHVRYPVGSPADRMLRGAALFTDYDRFVYFGESDPFLAQWRNQTSSFVDEVQKLQPSDFTNLLSRPSDYFKMVTPTEYASFMYDAVMTAGFSACHAWATSIGESHSDLVYRTEFSGASGPFRFKDGTNLNGDPIKENFRDPEHSIFGIYNIRPGEVDEDGMQR